MSITKEQLDEYIKLYQEGRPAISDEEYDDLLEEYLKEHGESNRPFSRQKQTSAVNFLVGTLPKVYGVTKPMREGMSVYTDWLRRKNITGKVMVQPKFDGCSVAYDTATNRFFTRGDTDNGESVDVTDVFGKRDFYDGEAIKFEAIMSKRNFEAFGKDYLRPRDVVSATITSHDSNTGAFISLLGLRYCIYDKQFIPGGLNDMSILVDCDDLSSIQQYIDNLLEDGATVTSDNVHYYECDGVVVSQLNDDGSVGEEVAIKILNMVEKTKLIRVEYQFGKTGRITPVAITEPVKFGNITVDHITLSTLNRIIELGLKENDTVSVMYNIVPYLMATDHDGDVPVSMSMPTTCPKCGSPLDYLTLKRVQCKNPQCEGRKLGAIIRYCQKMKMFGVSEKTITRFYEEGLIHSISDLYLLKPEDIETLSGMGKQSADNIVSSIALSSKGVLPHRWFGAFPMNDVGSRLWKLIFEYVFAPDIDVASTLRQMLYENALEELKDIIFDDAFNQPGIGSSIIERALKGLDANWDDMQKCIDYIEFKHTTDTVTPTKGRVSMTGTRDADTIAYLTQQGYEVADFSPNKTIALIIPNESFVSAKVTKAKEKNIPIYTLDEVRQKL